MNLLLSMQMFITCRLVSLCPCFCRKFGIGKAGILVLGYGINKFYSNEVSYPPCYPSVWDAAALMVLCACMMPEIIEAVTLQKQKNKLKRLVQCISGLHTVLIYLTKRVIAHLFAIIKLTVTRNIKSQSFVIILQTMTSRFNFRRKNCIMALTGAVKDIKNLYKKCVRLVQEMELVARGFTL